MIDQDHSAGPTPASGAPPAYDLWRRVAGAGHRRDGADRALPAQTRGWPMFHRVLPADPGAIQAALLELQDRFGPDVDGDALARVELVLAEVMNNVAQHGTGHGKGPPPGTPARALTIHLSVTAHEGGLACAVTDDGPPLPPSCLSAPEFARSPERAALAAGGFGWIIIRDLTQSLFYFREAQRNVLCFNIPGQLHLSPRSQSDVA